MTLWIAPFGDENHALQMGMKLSGGGVHLSKSMMLAEVKQLLPCIDRPDLDSLVLDANILSKKTESTRQITYRHLRYLYGIKNESPLTRTFWKLSQRDSATLPLNCLILSMAREPLFRLTASAILSAPIGHRVQWPALAELIENTFPNRFSPKMLRSLAQNCAASWTQSGHLEGSVRKTRQRVIPAPSNVAFAGLVASIAGYGGPALLSSPWMEALDLSPELALDLLRQAEGIGLARVRSAGDVTEISLRQPLQKTLEVPSLV
jgi:hypothetical protein